MQNNGLQSSMLTWRKHCGGRAQGITFLRDGIGKRRSTSSLKLLSAATPPDPVAHEGRASDFFSVSRLIHNRARRTATGTATREIFLLQLIAS
ncbi:MAG: hypothetical protein M3O50_10125 [Myxococcota bacterium]|nr:hypothetical protein [Myxococcota bacterium]